MRNLYILYPNIIESKQRAEEGVNRKSTSVVTAQLAEQKQINAELIRICEHQRRLLAEQSEMIAEILEGMGK